MKKDTIVLVEDGADLVSAAAIAVILLMPAADFSEKLWWLKPFTVLGIGWGLVARKSDLGPFVVSLGVILLVRAYRREKVHEAVLRTPLYDLGFS